MKRFVLFGSFIAIVFGGFLVYQEKIKSFSVLVEADIRSLPHWSNAHVSSSFQAFKHSCDVFLKQPASKNVGSDALPLTTTDWQKICVKAGQLNRANESQLKSFFEQNFRAVYFNKSEPLEGTFTGYYLPTLQGSWVKTADYQYPIYEVPKDLLSIDLGQFNQEYGHKRLIGRIQGKKFIPYYDRASINHGVLQQKAKPLLWVNSRIDRFFLEIQGSGYVDMTDGSRIMLGYAGQNGRSYKSIGRYLVEQGAFSKEQASMQSIRLFLREHPEAIDNTLNYNSSFIFFKKLSKDLAIGAQGAFLTPGYSLAVDRHYIPLGAPIWLETSYPDEATQQEKAFNRLMVAQDTGGAIKGEVRGDVFWGDLDNAAFIAGHMNQKGKYWILLPKKSPELG